MNHLFISYSRKDEALVTAVVQKLREADFEVWQDISGKTSGIPYSTKWFAAIEEALYTSAGAVTFESAAWKASTPCNQENELIGELSIPAFRIELGGRDAAASQDELTERIAQWAREAVYASEENGLRTWLLSSVHSYGMQKGRYAGIPHFKKRKDAKAFLERLDSCRTYVADNAFAEKSPALAENIQSFITRSKRITIWNLWKKPLAIALVVAIIVAAVVVIESYGQQKRHSDANIVALSAMDVVNKRVADDEMEALQLMARDTYDYAEFTPMLFEVYADVLSREYPAGFFQAGSAEAQEASALPAQDSLEGYEIELSETLGNVTVVSDPYDDNLRRTRVFHTASAPDAYALDDGYLAVASAQQVYLIDLARGYRAVELRYSYRDIAALRFDADGRICAVTTAGDVYVWDNPIARAIELGEAAPADLLVEQSAVSSDGRFLVQGSSEGTVEVRDVKNDCVIWQCTAITEPVEAVWLDEATWTVYARGLSGTLYGASASDVLSGYSTEPAQQRENYKAIGDALIDRLAVDLGIAWDYRQ